MMKQTYRQWIPLAVGITLVCGLVYLAGQQILRSTADDPQVQYAEDIAAGLHSGVPLEALVPPQQTDISQSIDPFAIVFDEQGNVIASSAILDGATTTIPHGVFDYAKAHGEDRITWQPQKGVRIGAVVEPYTAGDASSTSSGFILMGRSLRETEIHESKLLEMIALGWIVTLALTLIAIMGWQKMAKE